MRVAVEFELTFDCPDTEDIDTALKQYIKRNASVPFGYMLGNMKIAHVRKLESWELPNFRV